MIYKRQVGGTSLFALVAREAQGGCWWWREHEGVGGAEIPEFESDKKSRELYFAFAPGLVYDSWI